MSSRTSAGPAPASSLASPEDLRVQLEGSWEVLEQALEQKSTLLKRLGSARWRQHLQRDPELPRRVRELETPLAQALERVEHRLRQESWPKDHPLHRLTRQLHELEARLPERVRQRLTLWEPDGEWSFVEGLARLEARLREPLHQLPGEAEPVLLTGGADWSSGGNLFAFPLMIFGSLLARRLGLTGIEAYVSFFLMALYFLSMRHLRRWSRFWLTPRRLVWRTSRGLVRQVALDPHRSAFFAPFFPGNGVIVQQEDGRRTRLVGMEKLQVLRAMLTLRELPPLRGQPLGAPTYALAMFPVVRREKGGGFKQRNHSGVLVMRPGQLVFLEDKHLWNIVREVFHRAPDGFQGLTLSVLLQQLQLLPEVEFDRCLEELVRAGGGSRWESSAVSHGLTGSDQYEVLLPDGSVLSGVPDATQHAAISRVLQLSRTRT